MKSAHALWGIPVAVLKRAKGEGCSAFRAQRIHRTPLLQWIKENPEAASGADAENSSKAELEIRKLAAQVAQIELKVEKERGVLIKKGEAKDEWARAIAIVMEESKSLMDKEYFRVFADRIKSRIGEVLP